MIGETEKVHELINDRIDVSNYTRLSACSGTDGNEKVGQVGPIKNPSAPAPGGQ
ncbi:MULTISPECIES: hypothetical protein [unclassified Arenibacter]|uniref:hypothetical protein n=1 Tax=unclassified Arenibacter TaxID=2615047 RepID=UPI0015F2A9A8|nr:MULTISPECIES: hypothetical protein [unclassified Arenibacter]